MATARVSDGKERVERAAYSVIPGPKALSVLGWRGNILPLLHSPVKYMLWLYREYGAVVTFARGDNSFVFVFSPEYNHQVLSDPTLFYNGEINAPGSIIHIPQGTAALKLFSGITTMNGAKHTQQRRLLMPAFHKKRIEGLRDTMVSLAERHIAGWRAGQELDMLAEMKGLTLSVAVEAILGLDPRSEGDRVRTLMSRWLRVAFSPAILALPYDVPGLPFHHMLEMSKGLEGEVRGMVERRREVGRLSEGNDALSMLLQAHDEAGAALTDDELIGQTTALFVAGHETTASALTWTLFLLAQHPRVLHDLLDELRGKLNGSAPTLEQLNDLPLLDAVIKESMRLLPPGLWFLRVAQQDTYFGPYRIEEGTRVLWTPVVTHRLPELYPDPAAFKPERWFSINPSPYEYLPFSAGPRRCLGATFATMELKLVLPLILQRYTMRLPRVAHVDLAGSPLAQPKGGLRMKLAKPGARLVKSQVRGNIADIVDLN